jgi:predicted ABC-type ATPase
VPVLTLIAGPNGSGNSTATKFIDIEGRDRLLDPDAVAFRLNPADPPTAAISAAREVLVRIEEYLSERASFAVETTLAGKGHLDLLAKAKSLGYEVRLVYICLDTPELSLKRVRNRVLRGGHSVPDADVRRRYERSLANISLALELADYAEFYDNSGDGHRLVLVAKNGTIVWQADPLPAWVRI